jgi:hypothetical protein
VSIQSTIFGGIREFFKSEGVWHFVDSQEPSNVILIIQENSVWNKTKPNVEKELMEFEHKILQELEVKRAQNLE